MAGSKDGGVKAKNTNVLLYGRDYYKRIGALGGAASRGGGFGNGDKGKALARQWGAIGGALSRKGRKLTKAEKLQIIEDFKNREFKPKRPASQKSPKQLKRDKYLEEQHNDAREKMAALARKYAR